MRAIVPGLSLRTQICVVQIIVAVIHQIGFKRSSHHRLGIFGHISQKHIQRISATHLRLALYNRHFRFYRFHRFLLLRSCRTGFTLYIIIIRFNHDTFTYRHRNVKTIRIFYQYKIFSFESCYDSTAYLTEEAYFISYFHYCISC